MVSPKSTKQIITQIRNDNSVIMRYIHLSGVCTGMDTQQTTVLVAVMIGSGVVHPMMPNEQSKNKQLYWYFLKNLID